MNTPFDSVKWLILFFIVFDSLNWKKKRKQLVAEIKTDLFEFGSRVDAYMMMDVQTWFLW